MVNADAPVVGILLQLRTDSVTIPDEDDLRPFESFSSLHGALYQLLRREVASHGINGDAHS